MEKKTGVNQLGAYRLLRKLGEGGMGAVYLAEDTRDRRKVALKILPKKHGQDAEFVQRFRRETEVGTRLRHAHIVGAFEAGEDQGYHFYAMEYCEGEPLDKALKRESRFPLFKSFEIVRQIADGLRYLHDHGVIHRDIKPANIVLTPSGSARLLDLGLSKNLEQSENSFRTASGAVVGTPHYISPEQASGDKGIDGRTDIYSLGATFYHLLTGDPPFAGSTTVEVLYKHVHAQLPNPQDRRPEIPDAVVHVIRRMMAKSAGDRYRDCGDLIADLDELIGGATPKTVVLDAGKSSVAMQRGAAVPRRKSRAPLFAGIAVAAAVTVVAAVAISGGEKPPLPVVPARVEPVARKVALLPLVDPARDAVRGVWTREGQALVSDGENAARIELPYAPPDEYDLRVAFARRSGNDSVTLILTHAGKVFLCQMGAWDNTVLGIAEIDGKRANENPTTLRREKAIENGRAYVAIVEIRKDRVCVRLDGEKIAEWKTDYRDLGMNDDWKLRDASVLGLGSWGSVVEFRSVELAEVSGRGRALWPASR